MGKPKTQRALKDNEAKAVLRMLRISPQKLNLLAQLIRGKKVEKALAELEFSHKRISGQVRKVLESAIAMPRTTITSTPTLSSLLKLSLATRWL